MATGASLRHSTHAEIENFSYFLETLIRHVRVTNWVRQAVPRGRARHTEGSCPYFCSCVRNIQLKCWGSLQILLIGQSTEWYTQWRQLTRCLPLQTLVCQSCYSHNIILLFLSYEYATNCFVLQLQYIYCIQRIPKIVYRTDICFLIDQLLTALV